MTDEEMEAYRRINLHYQRPGTWTPVPLRSDDDDEVTGLTHTDYLICGIVIGMMVAGALMRWVA